MSQVALLLVLNIGVGPRSSRSTVILIRPTGENSVLGTKSSQRLTGRR